MEVLRRQGARSGGGGGVLTWGWAFGDGNHECGRVWMGVCVLKREDVAGSEMAGGERERAIVEWGVCGEQECRVGYRFAHVLVVDFV